MQKIIVLKSKCILVISKFMVPMATHYVTLKIGVYVQKYSFLSNTLSGTKLIPGHSSFIYWLDVEII